MLFSKAYTTIVLTYFAVIHAQTNTITIKTELGEIKGIQNKNAWSPTIIYEFKGIPYSTPMIGDLRFKESILNTSKYNGVYDATSFGAICPQPAPEQESNEDCLFLNIYTTKSNINNHKLVPVMFFIHGGGFIEGAGSQPFYNATNFIGENAGEIVYVSINYRLGALGFLTNEAIYNENPNWKSYGGNNGIYDQIIALQWVNKYISSFGGDKSQITVFGESGGGVSICTLLITPFAKDLFQRAMLESGPCIGGWGPQTLAHGMSECNQQLEAAGYPINNLTYLRGIPATELVTKVYPQQSVDGLILTDLPNNIYSDKNTKLNANDIVIGFNSLDGIYPWPNLFYFQPTNDKQYKSLISLFISNTTQQNEIYNKYYPPSSFPPYSAPNNVYNSSEYSIAMAAMNGDVCVVCPSILLAQQIMSNKFPPTVYVYDFEGAGLEDLYYAVHGSEVFYVYDNNNRTELALMEMPWDQNLSDSMTNSWNNFGKYGIPNINSLNVNIAWNAFTLNDENAIIFKGGGNGIENIKDFSTIYRENVCSFWYEEIGLEAMLNVCLNMPINNMTNIHKYSQ